ncbi:NTP/NDP exchange transporter [Sabulibacter ruber]|uniref:NTP/NDP exchange transporter n=1 Tax=Sabulibacter ruber TaxID=2811901 RepID=UPI001A95EAEA|nr:hypothetical protein [Sabulibacter ruber]
MNSKLHLLLNIKPAEARVVKQLFLVQFFLGIATAFLFTSTLAMFLHTFEAKDIPKVYIVSAGLLLVANAFYGKLEASLSAKKLLQTIIIFSGFSILFTWGGVSFLAARWVPFVLSAWNLVVYMLVGYAFWGMAAIIFNVRESKRLFSVVGSGDIPAKLMGYTAVSVLAPFLGVENLLWFSIGAFVLAYYFLKRFNHAAITGHHHAEHGHATGHGHGAEHAEHQSFISKYFQNRLIFFITLFSLLAFTVYSLIDYTLLAEVKSKFTSSPALATFIGVFFAVGRIMALFIKLLFSSRMISRLGLANSLLIAPVVLLLISGLLLLPGESEKMILYTFGVMVLLSEVLKSAVQEPAFFVLFQPLDPHSRLKGHLISKGYTMPVALLITGVFLAIFKYFNGGISIVTVCQILVVLLAGWITSVFLIKKEYLHTLINALKKGYFTGSELFLNDEPVRNVLIGKLESQNPKEVILALELLERSGYRNLEKRLLPLLDSRSEVIRRYVLFRIIGLKLTNAFPLIEKALRTDALGNARADFVQAYYFLSPTLQSISPQDPLEMQKAALIGLSLREESEAQQQVLQHLEALTKSAHLQDKLVTLDIISKAPRSLYAPLLKSLLFDTSEPVYKQAIETVGKVREASLIAPMLGVVQAKQATYSLQKSVLAFGDAFYQNQALFSPSLPENLFLQLVKTAGKVKGENSSQFLVQGMEKRPAYQDNIIESLWSKKATLDTSGQQQVQDWLKQKLEQSRQKALYCQSLLQNHELPLLASSLASELKHDVQKVLKSLALLYDRQQITRVMDLLALGSADKVANAIEMLEQLIPKKYFLPLELQIDFQLDKDKSLLPLGEKKRQEATQVIREIVTENTANCTNWTKSVACYSVLEVPSANLTGLLASAPPATGDYLFEETRGFVLSQLTPTAHVTN